MLKKIKEAYDKSKSYVKKLALGTSFLASVFLPDVSYSNSSTIKKEESLYKNIENAKVVYVKDFDLKKNTDNYDIKIRKFGNAWLVEDTNGIKPSSLENIIGKTFSETTNYLEKIKGGVFGLDFNEDNKVDALVFSLPDGLGSKTYFYDINNGSLYVSEKNGFKKTDLKNEKYRTLINSMVSYLSENSQNSFSKVKESYHNLKKSEKKFYQRDYNQRSSKKENEISTQTKKVKEKYAIKKINNNKTKEERNICLWERNGAYFLGEKESCEEKNIYLPIFEGKGFNWKAVKLREFPGTWVDSNNNGKIDEGDKIKIKGKTYELNEIYIHPHDEEKYGKLVDIAVYTGKEHIIDPIEGDSVYEIKVLRNINNNEIVPAYLDNLAPVPTLKDAILRVYNKSCDEENKECKLIEVGESKIKNGKVVSSNYNLEILDLENGEKLTWLNENGKINFGRLQDGIYGEKEGVVSIFSKKAEKVPLEGLKRHLIYESKNGKNFVSAFALAPKQEFLKMKVKVNDKIEGLEYWEKSKKDDISYNFGHIAGFYSLYLPIQLLGNAKNVVYFYPLTALPFIYDIILIADKSNNTVGLDNSFNIYPIETDKYYITIPGEKPGFGDGVIVGGTQGVIWGILNAEIHDTSKTKTSIKQQPVIEEKPTNPISPNPPDSGIGIPVQPEPVPTPTPSPLPTPTPEPTPIPITPPDSGIGIPVQPN